MLVCLFLLVDGEMACRESSYRNAGKFEYAYRQSFSLLLFRSMVITCMSKSSNDVAKYVVAANCRWSRCVAFTFVGFNSSFFVRLLDSWVCKDI